MFHKSGLEKILKPLSRFRKNCEIEHFSAYWYHFYSFVMSALGCQKVNF